MQNPEIIRNFEILVKNKFDIYNSLFLNLPFSNINNIGLLIPILYNFCKSKLESGSDPLEIIDDFFSKHTNVKSEEEKIEFLFKIIQYIERQVVLFDSIEDAAFSSMLEHSEYIPLKDYIHIYSENSNSEELLKKLSEFSIRYVFTAHPTQFYSPAVLDIINNLKILIQDNDIDGIDKALQQLGLTSLVNTRKPKPLDEAKNIIYYLENVYYDAIGELYHHIKSNIFGYEIDNYDLIQLGFWPGGDRDGNPFVKAKTTIDVADELRMRLIGCYYRDFENISKKLTFREIDNYIYELRTKLYLSQFDKNEEIHFEDILFPLLDIRDILVEKYNSLFIEELDKLIDKVKIFKTHFATLDIRQNHKIHENAVWQILIKEGIIKNDLDELSDDELTDILLNKNIDLKAGEFEDTLVKDVIKAMIAQKQIQLKNGEEGSNRYIISDSEDKYSVLFVYALLRWSAWHKGNINIDIVPLFETMKGMDNASSVMKQLFEIKQYNDHINHRNQHQTVMLGFSDGTKDGGYLKANWSIFETKESLTKVCNDFGIKALFFDGRGGPPARGGGKTHKFYSSLGNNIANNTIQLTVQGQTITSKYGTKEHFKNNSEQLLTAGMSHIIFSSNSDIPIVERSLIERLSQLSYEKYQALKDHDMFIPYLENKSTLKYYGKTNIGSRPVRRNQKDKLELKDLRAIPFVGSWNQLKQNVPGYFGIGYALKTLVDEGKTPELQQLFKANSFFKALISNSMMSLSKCYFELTSYIAKDEEYKEFWNILNDEYNLSKEMILLISGYDELMQEEPVAKRSIEIREKIVLPLLVIQNYALQKIELSDENVEVYEKIIRRSLYGNINASRNSA